MPSQNWDVSTYVTRTLARTDAIQTTNITVSFPSNYYPTDLATGDSGAVSFNSAQQSRAIGVLGLWEDLIAGSKLQFITADKAQVQIRFVNQTAGDGVETTTSTPYVHRNVWIKSSLANDIGGSQEVFGDRGVDTLLHEFGHALGLPHPGTYDVSDLVTPTYLNSAVFIQDDLQYSIMSYFDETNTGSNYGNYTQGNLSYQRAPQTPMLYDVALVQRLYGADYSTRSDDTTYGFNSNARSAFISGVDSVFDFSINRSPVICIWDGGGTDTLDCSGFANNRVITLQQGGFSSVGGLTSNVSIAYGAQIENAIGGAAGEQIIGNELDNRLLGNGGDDTLVPYTGSDFVDGGTGNDTLWLEGSRGAYSMTNLGGGQYRLAGAGSSLTFTNVESFRFDHGQGTLLSLSDLLATSRSSLAKNDFSGDGSSDILWRNTSGGLSVWALSANGGAVVQGAYNGQVDPSWKVVETLDWNGDGRSDILWRNTNGQLAVWNSTGSSFAGAYADGSVGSEWRIAGAGDYDGDGKGDIFWQNRDGSVAIWKSTGTAFQGVYFHASVGASWKVEGVGDFNGDGKADILWRNDNGQMATWLGTGGAFNEGGYFNGGVPSSWHIDGIGDFNGDGKDDILWRNDNGALSVWRSNGSGFDQGVYNTSVGTDWQIAQVGDYNGDGRADILWRNGNGAVTMWQSNGTGFNQSVYNSAAPTSWTIMGHDFPL